MAKGDMNPIDRAGGGFNPAGSSLTGLGPGLDPVGQ
jgi:hypothetical protein